MDKAELEGREEKPSMFGPDPVDEERKRLLALDASFWRSGSDAPFLEEALKVSTRDTLRWSAGAQGARGL